MSSHPVLTEATDGLLVVTINRPEARNAINGPVARGIRDAMQRLDSDPALRVAIITGAGGNFCAGMDLKALAAGEDVMNEVVIEGFGFGGLAEASVRKPLIAAVEGFALAGGLEIALACDLIVAGSDARFGIPEVKRGLVAGGGALLRLPRQMPRRLAMELALTGSIMTAATSLQYGLINRVVPAGNALAEAAVLARTIIENAPLAVEASKAIIARSQDWPSTSMFREQDALMAPVLASQDVKEGASAFSQKRQPVWLGK
ncbi:crotonase/enoyl-CoA hydratase family protein [Chelatococcus reniformis]|uniref:Enoyl CoA dehydratase/isomerase n=1 Tax=Chelatococcus reniformis TaxID=1494448 RepID=A0A916XJF1_9HYPH|nr:crotonase/enoyl-CoA hydratase family protein [Chelatococcus reniformis]GGC77817.1 enoyl CoA dehydratase/isomerase [Chelatococcus reniformis]